MPVAGRDEVLAIWPGTQSNAMRQLMPGEADRGAAICCAALADSVLGLELVMCLTPSLRALAGASGSRESGSYPVRVSRL
jgi:hypothetical protein